MIIRQIRWQDPWWSLCKLWDFTWENVWELAPPLVSYSKLYSCFSACRSSFEVRSKCSIVCGLFAFSSSTNQCDVVVSTVTSKFSVHNIPGNNSKRFCFSEVFPQIQCVSRNDGLSRNVKSQVYDVYDALKSHNGSCYRGTGEVQQKYSCKRKYYKKKTHSHRVAPKSIPVVA